MIKGGRGVARVEMLRHRIAPLMVLDNPERIPDVAVAHPHSILSPAGFTHLSGSLRLSSRPSERSEREPGSLAEVRRQALPWALGSSPRVTIEGVAPLVRSRPALG